ncbi:MAG: glucokinase [Gammaproteobacteria bacterium]|nr:glucokinase [Gammaproteobacteria bacterium]
MITLVADIGGTRIKMGITKDQTLLAQRSIEARSHEGLEPQLPRIAAAFASMCAEAGIQYADCCALGVAFPSVIELETGRVLTTFGKYLDAPQLDLPRWAREAFQLPLVMENDARVAQLGEWQAGAGRGCDDFVMVTLGTGLGTSALMGGQLVRGTHGQAGIFGGHITVRQGGRPCICGNRGCAEAEASTAVLPMIAREHRDFPSSGLRSLDVIDYAAVFRLARDHDVCAVALRAHSIEVWSALIVSLIHVFDPERVIIGGGIMSGAADCIADLARSVRARAHTPWGHVEIAPALLGDAAALIGAEFLVREKRAPSRQ